MRGPSRSARASSRRSPIRAPVHNRTALETRSRRVEHQLEADHPDGRVTGVVEPRAPDPSTRSSTARAPGGEPATVNGSSSGSGNRLVPCPAGPRRGPGSCGPGAGRRPTTSCARRPERRPQDQQREVGRAPRRTAVTVMRRLLLGHARPAPRGPRPPGRRSARGSRRGVGGRRARPSSAARWPRCCQPAPPHLGLNRRLGGRDLRRAARVRKEPPT